MDKSKFGKREIQAIGASVVKLELPYFLHPDYEINLFSNKVGSETGFIEFVGLIPKKPGIPSFVFRWDHGKQTMDIDIKLEKHNQKALWGQLGYKGYHPMRLDENLHKYDAQIKKLPDEIIFRGIIDIGVLVGLYLKDNIGITDNVTVQIIQP